MPVCVKKERNGQPVPTKAFLQPAKAATMCTAPRAETPYPTFFASAKPIFKTDSAYW